MDFDSTVYPLRPAWMEIDLAELKNSVSYDVLTNWRLRLRRKAVNGGKQIQTKMAQINTGLTGAIP